MKTIKNNKIEYGVVDVRRETHDVVTLKLVDEAGSVPRFIPGQFITVYFPDLNTPEGKSYSISSTIQEDTLNITVKAIGEFSNRLCSMQKNDQILISPPYGFFYTENTDTDLVIFAAGIGIVPFRSMIIDILSKYPKRKITLCLSNKTVHDIVFKKEFDNLEKKDKLKIHHYLTRENNISSPFIQGRINIEEFIGTHPHKEKTEYFICGSISFVRDIWKELINNGVPEETIYTEAFFSH